MQNSRSAAAKSFAACGFSPCRSAAAQEAAAAAQTGGSQGRAPVTVAAAAGREFYQEARSVESVDLAKRADSGSIQIRKNWENQQATARTSTFAPAEGTAAAVAAPL